MGAVSSGGTTTRSSSFERLMTSVLMVSGCVLIEAGSSSHLKEVKRMLNLAIKVEGMKKEDLPVVVAVKTDLLS